MASANLYQAAIDFLSGDNGDIRTKVNAEQPNALALGSVLASRDSRSRATRQANSMPLSVSIVLHELPSPRAIGLGWDERDVVLDLAIEIRQKDVSTGALQVAKLENVVRSLTTRYRLATNLAITVSDPVGNTAIFRRASAVVAAVDQTYDSAELARAVVRLTLTFNEEQPSNA